MSLSSTPAAGQPTDVLVVGVAQGRRGPVLVPGGEPVDAAFGGRLLAALAAVGATGKLEEITRIATLGATTAPSLIAVGFGAAADGSAYPAETLRRTAGAAVRAAAGSKRAAMTLALANGGPEPRDVGAVAEGALLGGYSFTRYRHASLADRKPPVGSVALIVPEPRAAGSRDAVRRADVLAQSVALARDLVNTPPVDLHPADLAEAAVQACAGLDLAIEVLDERALARGGYGGILGVGAGAADPPRLVRIGYRHPGSTRTIALIGKGITFDSGGLSLKPAKAMEEMKSDMAGAAAVIATMVAVGKRQPTLNVTGWVPSAENLPSGSAIRPSDVLTMYGGKRVEVLNTDAEGRLVLADALVRSGEERPDFVVDVATLTGAQIVALGTRTAAVMGNDDGFRDRVAAAAGRAGEPAWPMPLPRELRRSLDSEVADLANVGERYGGMLVAGLFLREFVAEGIPWAHLDIAGPSYNSGEPYGYTPTGGTGTAVRTFIELIEELAADAGPG